MMRHLIMAALLLLPGAALACSPAIRAPSPVPTQGPHCAYSMDLNEIDTVILGGAERAPSGLILQALSDGNGCYARFNLVVHDCAAGQVMVIGTEHFSLMDAAGQDPEVRPGIEIIREAAMAGELATLADLTAASEARGYGVPLVLRPNQSLQFEGQSLPLSCACREAGRGG
jgi:hypothetical protein